LIGLPGQIVAELERALARERREVVGLLVAPPGSTTAMGFWRLTNHAQDAGSFTVDGAELERVVRALARRHLRPLAFLHSHPSGLDLSPADRRVLRRLDLPGIVVSRRAGGVAWKEHAVPA
jgi:proteasome lid subunit RPN8/RPN11